MVQAITQSSTQIFEIKSLAWHKKQAARSESWSRKMCEELGITPEDLRLIVDQRVAH